jgi:hypothetical protein
VMTYFGLSADDDGPELAIGPAGAWLRGRF